MMNKQIVPKIRKTEYSSYSDFRNDIDDLKNDFIKQ